MVNKLSDIQSEITADPSAFIKAVKQAAKSANQFSDDVSSGSDKIVSKLSTVSASAVGLVASIGAIGAGLAVLTVESMKSNDELAKFSDKIGESIVNVRAFQQVAKDNGISVDAMNDALEETALRLGEAIHGTGATADQLKLLNLEAKELIKLSPAEVIQKYGEEINKLSNREEKLFAITELIGDEARGLINIFDQGSDVLSAYVKKIEKTGVALSRIDAAKIEESNSAISDLGLLAEGTGNTIAKNLAPLITAISHKLFDVASGTDIVEKITQRTVKIIVKSLAFLAQSYQGIVLVVDFVKLAVNGLYRVMLKGAKLSAQAVIKVSDYFGKLKAKLTGQDYQKTGGGLMENFIRGIDTALKLNEPRIDILAKNLFKQFNVVASEEASKSVTAYFEQSFKKSQELATLKSAKVTDQNSVMGSLTLAPDNDNKPEAESVTQSLRVRWLKEQHEEMIAQGERYAKAKLLMESRTNKQLAVIQTGHLASAFGAFSGHSKKMFKLQKAAKLAHAVITLPSSILESFHNSGGYPWGIPAALAMAAQGAAQINSIRSASFGGGGSAPSVGGSAPTQIGGTPDLSSNETATENTERSGIIEIKWPENTQMISTDAMREFIEQVQDQAPDMGIRFA